MSVNVLRLRNVSKTLYQLLNSIPLLARDSIKGTRTPQAGLWWDTESKHVIFAFHTCDSPGANPFASLSQLLLV